MEKSSNFITSISPNHFVGKLFPEWLLNNYLTRENDSPSVKKSCPTFFDCLMSANIYDEQKWGFFKSNTRNIKEFNLHSGLGNVWEVQRCLLCQNADTEKKSSLSVSDIFKLHKSFIERSYWNLFLIELIFILFIVIGLRFPNLIQWKTVFACWINHLNLIL